MGGVLSYWNDLLGVQPPPTYLDPAHLFGTVAFRVCFLQRLVLSNLTYVGVFSFNDDVDSNMSVLHEGSHAYNCCSSEVPSVNSGTS